MSTFRIDTSKLTANIRKVPDRVNTMVTKVTELHGTRGENRMRKNAPWKDRTTNARNGLHTRVTHSGTEHTIVFAHGVSYGIFLEIRWAGRYQIIMPTVTDEGRDMMSSFNRLFGKM